MLRHKILLYFVAAMRTCVLATPAGFNFPLAIHGHGDSTESRSLAGPILVNSSLPDRTNLTVPAVNLPELNTSSNAEPIIFCHQNPQLPAPPIFGHTDVVECALLVMSMLADEPADLHAWQWSPTYPVVLPWTIGVVPQCRVVVRVAKPGASDVFQLAMVAQRAALIVSRCVDNLGGLVSVGPREDFLVDVFAFPPHATA